MAPRRSKPKPKHDHCSYVQHLFKDFLQRNHQPRQLHQEAVPRLQPKPIQRPVQRFVIDDNNAGGGSRSNVYLQGVLQHLNQAQNNNNVNPSTNLVQTFFKQPAAPGNVRPRTATNQAVQVRFKRQGQGSDQFVKREPSPSVRPRGLMQWLDERKKSKVEKQLVDQQNNPRRKTAEHLNLPGDFFSGRESMQLPFAPIGGGGGSAADKTLMSVGSRFVPPATSTPFDGKAIMCSPIMSDPAELSPRREVCLPPSNDCLSFLEDVGKALDQFSLTLCPKGSSPLDRNWNTLQQIWKCLPENQLPPPATLEDSFPPSLVERSSFQDHSLISNQIYRQYRKRPPSPSIFDRTVAAEKTLDLNDSSTVIEIELGRDRVAAAGNQPPIEPTAKSFQELLQIGARNRDQLMESLLSASPPGPVIHDDISELLGEEFSPSTQTHRHLKVAAAASKPFKPMHNFSCATTTLDSFELSQANNSFEFDLSQQAGNDDSFDFDFSQQADAGRTFDFDFGRNDVDFDLSQQAEVEDDIFGFEESKNVTTLSFLPPTPPRKPRKRTRAPPLAESFLF